MPVSQVWWTADGAVWIRATSAAAFTVRRAAVLLVLSGQLWLFGGDCAYLPPREVWASTDGVQWVAQAPLPSGMTEFAAVVLNSNILTTGYAATEYNTVGVSPGPSPANSRLWRAHVG